MSGKAVETAHRADFAVLGIETSCDETAAAILASDGRVLADAVLSQQDHAAFGGVVPEIAARAHLHHLPRLVEQVLTVSGLRIADLTAIAATTGPGLVGGLIVGSGLAKGMAMAAGSRFIAINHLEAHALTARLPGVTEGGAPFPYLLLLVSGGHCQLVRVDGVERYVRLGSTIDDAVGEAFDKVAKMLGLGWPGGPALERLAAEGRPRIALPRPLLGRAGCDFSFSGLKTAVAQVLAPHPGPLPRVVAADIAASFQAAVVDVLADRVGHAIAMAPECRHARGRRWRRGQPRHPRRAGRSTAAGAWLDHGSAPKLALCGDNAVMVAWAAIERLRAGAVPDAARCLGSPAAPALATCRPGRRGMNYRHAYHAGNFADCMKHALFVWLLRAAMARKDTPFLVLDTHAGTGATDLERRRTSAHQAKPHPAFFACSIAPDPALGRLPVGHPRAWVCIPARPRSHRQCCGRRANRSGWRPAGLLRAPSGGLSPRCAGGSRVPNRSVCITATGMRR